MSRYYRVKTLMLKGQKGDGIKEIKKTGTSGLVDTYTITLADGATSTFTVTNGEKGDKGEKGDTGDSDYQPAVDALRTQVNNLKEDKEDIEKHFVEPINRLNLTTFTEKKKIDFSNGELIDKGDLNTSDYIKIKKGKTYTS